LNPAAADRARASGAVAQLGNLGTTTGTPLLALMIAGFGAAGVVAFALPLCLLGMAIHQLQARRRNRMDAPAR
jgi:predicted MFS family arabinose efflux permease